MCHKSKSMKISLHGLVMILNLSVKMMVIIHLAGARSLPTVELIARENQKMTRREANPESSTGISTVSEVTQLQHELDSLSIPSYLKDMYINLTYPDGAARPSHDEEETEANTIQSYMNQAKNGDCEYYKFDVHKDTTDGEKMVRAELRLLQKESATLGSHYNVDIYSNENTFQSMPHISFRNVDSTPGWKTFDITPIVLQWKQGLDNDGIRLRITKEKKVLSCEGVFSQGEQDPMNTKPLLIVFTNDNDSEFFTQMLKEETKDSDAMTQPQKRRRRATNVEVQNSACHRKKMVVTATSLSTDDLRMMLPKSFDAGVCEGHCTKLQLSPNIDHAHILSLHYLNTNVKLNDIPSRCCVPTKYQKLNMIFYNATADEHIIKTNVMAQATECKCL